MNAPKTCNEGVLTISAKFVDSDMIVTELLSVSIQCQKKLILFSGCTRRVGPPQTSHMRLESHKEQIHPEQNFA